MLVEGSDDFDLLICIIKYFNLPGIQVVPLDGIGNLGDRLRAVKLTLTPEITSVGIIRDADRNFARAFKSVCRALKNADFPVPNSIMLKTQEEPFVQVMILPDNKNPGYFEDLCIASLDSDSLSCIDEFITCMKKHEKLLSKNQSKSKVYAYIAAQKNPRMTLGCSAHEDCWNFDHPAFTELVTFLRSL